MTQISRSTDYDKDPQAKEKMLQETNLFKFFLSGISILMDVTSDSNLKEQLMKEVVAKAKDQLKERTTRFFLLAARSAFMRVKLSTENTYDLFMEFLNSLKLDVPDGADFIDAIGSGFAKFNIAVMIRMVPALNNFLNWLLEEGLFDFHFGVLVKGGAVHVRIQTEGIKELYEKVMAGFM